MNKVMNMVLVATLAIVTASSVSASTLLFGDNCNDGALANPSYSPTGANWVVEQGSYDIAAGFMWDNNPVVSRISINFGTTAANTSVEARFKLYNCWESQSFYRYIFGFKNTATGYYLEEHSSPNGGMNEGVCGFSNMMMTGSAPNDWYIGKGDVNGAALSHVGGEWNYLKLRFDPTAGVEVLQAKSSNANLSYEDSSLTYTRVAHWSNFWNMTSVNQFYMGSFNDEPWAMDDIEIVGTSAVPEPSSLFAIMSGLAGIAGFAIRRRK